jgi:superfamily II DNA or RNA helicase
VHQAADRFELRTPGVRAGRIGEGAWDEGDGVGVCATFQTIYRGLKRHCKRTKALLESVVGVVVDEAHTLPAASFFAVLMRCVNAVYRMGVSGTPLARSDQRSLMAVAALGPVVYRVRAEVLIEKGVLAKPTVRMQTVMQQSDCPTWQGVYGEAVVRSAVRNSAIVACAVKATKPALVFIKEVSHGKKLMRMLEAKGLRAEFTWGQHSNDWRTTMIDRLVRADLDVLVCSVIFQEGIDIPSLRSVIIGTGGKSVIAAIQRVGRGMRIERNAAGEVIKDSFEVYDIWDRGNRIMERHARLRLKSYQADGYDTFIDQ